MKETIRPLSESMFFVLVALKQSAKSGIEICDYVSVLTNGRVPLPPGTLYTILAKFEDDEIIREVKIEGRKRTYELTDKGNDVLNNEHQRIQLVLKECEGIL